MLSEKILDRGYVTVPLTSNFVMPMMCMHMATSACIPSPGEAGQLQPSLRCAQTDAMHSGPEDSRNRLAAAAPSISSRLPVDFRPPSCGLPRQWRDRPRLTLMRLDLIPFRPPSPSPADVALLAAFLSFPLRVVSHAHSASITSTYGLFSWGTRSPKIQQIKFKSV